MQFFTLASLFAAALAAPAPQTSDCPNPAHCPGQTPSPVNTENVDISNFYLRKNDGKVQSIGFSLSGSNATGLECATSTPPQPDERISCGNSEISGYRFGLVEPVDLSSSQVNLTIIHQTAPFVGRMGEGSVPTYCRAGGNGPNDFVCQQVSEVTIVIQG